jgi:hypothetical protein
VTHHNQQDSSKSGIGLSQRSLIDNTQHLKETHIHVFGGIWTRNCGKRAVADPRVRPLGLWDQQMCD